MDGTPKANPRLSPYQAASVTSIMHLRHAQPMAAVSRRSTDGRGQASGDGILPPLRGCLGQRGTGTAPIRVAQRLFAHIELEEPDLLQHVTGPEVDGCIGRSSRWASSHAVVVFPPREILQSTWTGATLASTSPSPIALLRLRGCRAPSGSSRMKTRSLLGPVACARCACCRPGALHDQPPWEGWLQPQPGHYQASP